MCDEGRTRGVYAKVFKSMWQGTLGNSWEGWATFVYLLAHCDRAGLVDMTPEAISRGSSLPMEVVRRGLEILEAPDPSSRSTDLEGRRLERIDPSREWGWRIVNYEHYRTLRDSETIQRQTLERVRRHRVTLCNAVKRSVTHGNAMQKQRQMQITDKDLVSVPLTVGGSDGNGTRKGAKREALLDHAPLPPGELTSDEVFSEVFWPEYPRKVARRAAEAAWKRLRLRDTDEETMVAIMAGLRRDVRGDWKGREQDKIPHASTWLNQRRWEG